MFLTSLSGTDVRVWWGARRTRNSMHPPTGTRYDGAKHRQRVPKYNVCTTYAWYETKYAKRRIEGGEPWTKQNIILRKQETTYMNKNTQ